MPDAATTGDVQELSDDREAAKQHYIAMCVLAHNAAGSDEHRATRDAVDMALEAWLAAIARHERAAAEAGADVATDADVSSAA